MKITMFPGQGSQFKGMGAGLFEQFRSLTEQADAILGYSLKALCTEDPRNELGRTQFTQPALYVVNALSYLKRLEDTQGTPDFVMGHSLGEFNALLAAGCFDFETGLRLVRKRGELMGQVSDGGMAAVLNASKEHIEATLKAHGLERLYLANYNTPSQIVLSGHVEELARAEPLFKEGKMRFYPLATSGAFHSAFMHDAMLKFREVLDGHAFAAPKIPVIANVTARPYEAGAIVDTLARQIASTVRWSESVQHLLAATALQGEPAEFDEVGPGDVLTKLVFTIKAQTPAPAAAPAPVPAAAPAADTTTATTTAAGKVRDWNRRHPVGTRVRSTMVADAELETRTDAVLLFGHRAAVYLTGFNGYFDLDELTAVADMTTA